MCGIFALFNPPGMPVDLGSCRAAVNALGHRGPDAYGEWISPESDVFLGHRRLALLDLRPEAGQPMAGESGGVIVFNGEIYNYQEIRDELRQRGQIFQTNCDTEVLLAALETWGTDALTRMEGMFAFIWRDSRTGEVVAARDFFGIKPLYYVQLPSGALAFASEIKAFLELPGFIPETNRDRLPEFLQFRGLSGPYTLFKGVMQLEAGCEMRFGADLRRLRFRRYWDPLKECRKPVTGNLDEFQALFRGVIERHLIADAPVGAQFSGGIDSALISVIAKRDLGAPLTGFHCETPDADYNETPDAYAAAREIGMSLTTTRLTADIFFSELFETLTFHHDEPLMHPNSVGIYLISREAKQSVKALLSGEAADELFCGYGKYAVVAAMDAGIRLLGPGGFEAVSKAVGGLLPSAMRSMAGGVNQYMVSSGGHMPRSTLNALLGDQNGHIKSVESRETLIESIEEPDPLRRARLYDVITYLPPLFMRQDKMSMAASIENRVPFAVPRVYQFALSLARGDLVSLRGRKLLLKRLLELYFPRRLVQRKKWGFGIPIHRWFAAAPGRERLHSLVQPESRLRDELDPRYVEQLVRSFRGGLPDANVLFTLLSFHTWLTVRGSKPPRSENGNACEYGYSAMVSM